MSLRSIAIISICLDALALLSLFLGCYDYDLGHITDIKTVLMWPGIFLGASALLLVFANSAKTNPRFR